MSKLGLKIFLIALIGLLSLALGVVYLILPLSYILADKFNGGPTASAIIQLLLIVTLGVGPVLTLFWCLINKWLIQPVVEMESITATIATGNLAKRLTVLSNDELSGLSKNINQIISNLLSALQSMIVELKNNTQQKQVLSKNVEELNRARQQTQLAMVNLHNEKTKLQAMYAKDKALLSNLGDAVIGIDNQKKVFLFNQKACEISGYTQLESMGMVYSMVLRFVTEKQGNEVDFISQAFMKQQPISAERISIVGKNGQKTTVSAIVTPIFDSNKTLHGVVTVLRNVTRERQLEKLKDEFVSVVSHELRTPMTAIKGMVSMILEGDYGGLSEKLKDPLTDVYKSANQLIELVNDTLDVSRIEAGRVKISLAVFNLPDIISGAVKSLEPLARMQNLQLTCDSGTSLQVQADPNKTKQILNNLIGNSLKFTQKGKINIFTRTNGQRVEVGVEDTGIGIAPGDQNKLFFKFAQISTQETGKPSGTGLGLYISKQLCQIMGGDLWVDKSVPGEGSTFVFSLPLAGSELAQKTAAAVSKYLEAKAV